MTRNWPAWCCKARAKSSLIMQQESSSARASSIARDWYHLGRVTSLEEVRNRIENLTVPQLLDQAFDLRRIGNSGFRCGR